jgi:hypothetical protein
VQQLEHVLGRRDLKVLVGLESPLKIQAFLDRIPYSADPIYRCPRRVLQDRKAHCYDGALFAAAMLRRLGYPPLILDMFAVRDDDHILALYKKDGLWGAVAKSNFVGLRYREPIYRTLRELVMSYFELFFNVDRQKTLRSYTVPLNMSTFDRLDWMVRDEPLDTVAQRLDEIRRIPLLSERSIQGLCLTDERSYRAGMEGVNRAGLYKPGR